MSHPDVPDFFGNPDGCDESQQDKGQGANLRDQGETTGETPDFQHLGVSKNRGTPKGMVYNNGKPYFLMDDLGVPLISETSISYSGDVPQGCTRNPNAGFR